MEYKYEVTRVFMYVPQIDQVTLQRGPAPQVKNQSKVFGLNAVL